MLEPRFIKVPGLHASKLIKKETPTQVFPCEYCEIFKFTYFEEHLGTAVFVSEVTETTLDHLN